MKPPRHTLPLAVLGADSICSRPPTAATAGRMELLALWDWLSDEARRELLAMARAKAEEERTREATADLP